MRVWATMVSWLSVERGGTWIEAALAVSFIVLSSLAALRMIGVRVDLDFQQLIDLFR